MRYALRLALLLSVTLPAFSQPDLPIPPLAEATRGRDGVVRFRLEADEGEMEFLPGLSTETLGFSGDYLGPTIRVSQGDRVEIAVANRLSEVTTVHWHGLHVPAESDGGPHQTVEPGGRWTARFTVDQEAATLWYHPHPMGATGTQVYRGLAGLFIVDDDSEPALPSTYGVDDIPIILQDRRFDADGEFVYARSMPEVIHGFPGDVLLVNGAIKPVYRAPEGLVRFRILNASDTNVFRIRFSDGRSFHIVASDGGYLSAPLRRDAAVIATGERVEIVVDTQRPADGGDLIMLADDMYRTTFDAVSIVTDPDRVAKYTSLEAGADQFRPIPPVEVPEDAPVRRFVMSSMGPGGQLTINGRHMDIDRIDFRIPMGRTEIWEIVNEQRGMMGVPHTFHIHDGQYRVIEINGESPPEELSGWKDTWLLWPNDRIRVLVRFEDYAGIYMYHCHFLVHEDFGMMGQFEVYRP